MANTTHLALLSAIALATTVACGGSQKEAEAPADDSADAASTDDAMMDTAESDMPDDGFEDEAAGEEMPEDSEMTE